MDTGNVYGHDFDNVADEIVWHAVQHSLGTLPAAIEEEIARLPGKA
jgi:uncharacterized protein with HEPN domain